MIKRAFDLLVSGLLLLISLPVFAVLVGAILVLEGRPIFFVQRRVGRDLRTFPMVKFRTMKTGSFAGDLAPGQSAVELRSKYQATRFNDTRVTPIGRLLRKTSLDELPQLLNVFAGQMSLVGPRPDVPVQEADYTPEQWRERHRVKPGITGWAQVNGRSLLDPETRIRLDLEYVRRSSIALDLKILLMTAKQVLRLTGAA